MQFHQLKHFAHGERRHAASVQLCPSPLLGRRRFMIGTAAALAVGCLPAEANVPVPYDWNAAPPMDDKLSFIEWMAGQGLIPYPLRRPIRMPVMA